MVDFGKMIDKLIEISTNEDISEEMKFKLDEVIDELIHLEIEHNGDKVLVEAEVEKKCGETWENQIQEARLKGYEGEVCTYCDQFTLVRNGSCLKCITCGETSGCS